MPLESNSELSVICAWCGLLKTENIWPEPWLKQKTYVTPNNPLWNRSSHGICPECFDEMMEASEPKEKEK